jgi:hypothetical protein
MRLQTVRLVLAWCSSLRLGHRPPHRFNLVGYWNPIFDEDWLERLPGPHRRPQRWAMTRLRMKLFSVIVALVLLSIAAAAAQAVSAQTSDDGRREFVVTGCLLRNGYAVYKLDPARVDAIDGKTVKDAPSDSPLARLTAWNLEGGGNLGPRTGEKVQVVGLTTWKEAADSEGPRRTPMLEVKSVKTVSASCDWDGTG